MAKVLIVEDDLILLKMYKTKFEIEKFDVQTAENGKDGLEKMRSFKPDIVLMDVMMPILDGLSALKEAKQDPQIKNIPIVILTNLSTEHDANKAVQLGAFAHLVKSSMTPSDVVNKTKEFLTATGKNSG